MANSFYSGMVEFTEPDYFAGGSKFFGAAPTGSVGNIAGGNDPSVRKHGLHAQNPPPFKGRIRRWGPPAEVIIPPIPTPIIAHVRIIKSDAWKLVNTGDGLPFRGRARWLSHSIVPVASRQVKCPFIVKHGVMFTPGLLEGEFFTPGLVAGRSDGDGAQIEPAGC